MNSRSLAALLSVTTLVAARAASAVGGEVVIERCMVSLGEEGEAQVAAREAGVIEELKVRKGMEVAADDDLAILDSDQPKMELRKAQAELSQAQAKAENTVDIEYGRTAHEKAKAELEGKRQANERSPGSVTASQMRVDELEVEKTRLSIKQAELEKENSALAAVVKQVEVDAATHAIGRRQIRSPISGMVLDVFKHKGEWMQPGDALAHVIRTDVVQVDAFVTKALARVIMKGTPVKVILAGGDGKAEEFEGQVSYVRPKEESGEYRIYAEVKNRKADGTWLLQFGQEVTMKVTVPDPAPAGK